MRRGSLFRLLRFQGPRCGSGGNPEALHLFMQRGGQQPEGLGGPALVAVRGGQRGQDEAAFVIEDHVFQGHGFTYSSAFARYSYRSAVMGSTAAARRAGM